MQGGPCWPGNSRKSWCKGHEVAWRWALLVAPFLPSHLQSALHLPLTVLPDMSPGDGASVLPLQPQSTRSICSLFPAKFPSKSLSSSLPGVEEEEGRIGGRAQRGLRLWPVTAVRRPRTRVSPRGVWEPISEELRLLRVCGSQSQTSVMGNSRDIYPGCGRMRHLPCPIAVPLRASPAR